MRTRGVARLWRSRARGPVLDSREVGGARRPPKKDNAPRRSSSCDTMAERRCSRRDVVARASGAGRDGHGCLRPRRRCSGWERSGRLHCGGRAHAPAHRARPHAACAVGGEHVFVALELVRLGQLAAAYFSRLVSKRSRRLLNRHSERCRLGDASRDARRGRGAGVAGPARRHGARFGRRLLGRLHRGDLGYLAVLIQTKPHSTNVDMHLPLLFAP